MKEFVKIALRNLVRHKRRTVLTGLGIMLGGFVLVFGRACGDGLRAQMFSTMIAIDTGHITITAAEENGGEESDLDRAIGAIGSRKKGWLAHPEKIEEAVAGFAGVAGVSRRIEMRGLFFAGHKMHEGIITGIEPAKEQDLLLKAVTPAAGRRLRQDDDYGIYISEAQADKFALGVGDSVAVMARTMDGGMNTVDFLVTGIFKKSAPWHENRAYVNLERVQELAVAGNSVSQIKVLLEEPKRAGTFAAELQEYFSGREEVAVEDWETAGGFFTGSVLASTLTLSMVNIVLFIIIAAGVVNTMLTAVFERVREIGMMAAVGTGRRQIRLLFLMEAAMLGVFSGGLGVFLGSMTALWLGEAGIPAVNEAARYAFGAESMYPLLTGVNVLSSYLLLVLAAVVSAYYPARVASGLKPVDALSRV